MNQQAMIRDFLPRLLEYGHFNAILREANLNRLSRCFDALKRPYLLRKIEISHRRKQGLLAVKKTFAALKLYTVFMRDVN